MFGGNDSIDLDAGCVLMDSTGKTIDTIWFRKLESTCKAVVHSGDNLTGEGDGDDEVIKVNLSRLPANVEYGVYGKQLPWSVVQWRRKRVLPRGRSNRKELARYKLTEQGSHTGIVISSLRRNNGNWDFTALGHACRGRTIDDMHSDIVSAVIR